MCILQLGDPASSMVVILEGELQARGDIRRRNLCDSVRGRRGHRSAAFFQNEEVSVTGRALTESRILKFPSAHFPELIQKMPELTKRLVGVMSDRIREVTRMEQQRDRLAGLGKLSAGLAHELNNPASAAKRATSQLRDTLKRIKDASPGTGKARPYARPEIGNRKAGSFVHAAERNPLDALATSDLEDQIDSLLRSHGQNDLWQLAADLAHRGVKPEVLESLFATLDADVARAALVSIAASVEIANLLNEIESSTSRISDLVRAIKEYTYMDQTPGAKCGRDQRPGEHAHHPESQTQARSYGAARV